MPFAHIHVNIELTGVVATIHVLIVQYVDGLNFLCVYDKAACMFNSDEGVTLLQGE